MDYKAQKSLNIYTKNKFLVTLIPNRVSQRGGAKVKIFLRWSYNRYSWVADEDQKKVLSVYISNLKLDTR